MDYCWGGLVDMTKDRFPRAGEADGVHFAMGYSGHGAQIATHMGEIVADQILGRARTNPWSSLPGPPSPATSVNPGSCRSSGLTTSSRTRSGEGQICVMKLKRAGAEPAFLL
ncbi:FAD-dependent oxidoreductase [Pannonibacter sp. Pt2-lr]